MAPSEHGNVPSGSTKSELRKQLHYYQLLSKDLMYMGKTNLFSYLTVHTPRIILTNNYKNQQMNVQLLKPYVT
jgi:hypothetical protein